MGKIMTAQAKIISLLEADAFFVDRTDPEHPVVKVPLVSKRVGDIGAAIDEKLAEIGIGLIVIFRGFKRTTAPGGSLAGEMQFALTAVENVTVNEDPERTAEDIVEKAADILDNAPSGVGSSRTARFYADRNSISPLPFRGKKFAAVNSQILLVNAGTILNTSPA